MKRIISLVILLIGLLVFFWNQIIWLINQLSGNSPFNSWVLIPAAIIFVFLFLFDYKKETNKYYLGGFRIGHYVIGVRKTLREVIKFPEVDVDGLRVFWEIVHSEDYKSTIKEETQKIKDILSPGMDLSLSPILVINLNIEKRIGARIIRVEKIS